MKRRLSAIIITLAVAGTLAACGSKPANSSQAGQPQSTSAAQESAGQNSSVQEPAGQKDQNSETSSPEGSDTQEEGVITGTLQENKGFMFLLTGSEDNETYVFPLAEDQSELLNDFKEGDSMKVTYKNGLPTPDNVDTVVVKVEKAE